MSRPTAAQLIEELRELHGGAGVSDEQLTYHLPISGSTLARWKRGNTRSFDSIVEMMDQVGWLNTDGDRLPTVQKARPPGDLLAEIATGVALLIRLQEKALTIAAANRDAAQGDGQSESPQ